MAEEFALVRCCQCGEYTEVPWELLGDTDPRAIDDYRCGVCEPDEFEGDEYDPADEYEPNFDNDYDDYE